MRMGALSHARILLAALAGVVALTGVGVAATAKAAPATAKAAPAASAGRAFGQSRPQFIGIGAIGDRYHVLTPRGLHAGLARITFFNADDGPHQAQLFLLTPGVTFAQFKSDLLSNNPAAVDGQDATGWGGAAVTGPHQAQVEYEGLPGGTYAVVCFVRDEHGVPHFVMGMISSFTVAGPREFDQVSSLAPPVRVAGEIDAHDMTYTMPATLYQGRYYLFRDTDGDGDQHELNIARLQPGRTVADARAWFRDPAGPPPFDWSGGAGGVRANSQPDQWFRVTATPGNYIAFCLIPDDTTHMPHAAMGMVVGFTVR